MHDVQQGVGAELRRRREDTVIRNTLATVAEPPAGGPGTAGGPAGGVCRVVPFEEQPLVGDDAVRRHFDAMLAAFPDLAHEVLSIHHSADVVILEGRINGTQAADWQGIPNRGKRMELPVAVLSQFDGELLVDGTLYYDRAVAARQLV
ncbi:ester cyclase [Streptomyces kanasensis]|uniref:ester cyclase n=1 Tax=Streptomyces kanasensis TaxID=936756 RepID=UPI00382D0280